MDEEGTLFSQPPRVLMTLQRYFNAVVLCVSLRAAAVVNAAFGKLVREFH